MAKTKTKVVTVGPIRINKTTIESYMRHLESGVRTRLRDSESRGLELNLHSKTASWSASYRLRGVDPATGRRWPNKSLLIGNPATHDPVQARLENNRIRGQVARGLDPVEIRKAEAAKQQRERSETAERLLASYTKALPARSKMRGTPGRLSERYVAEELSQLRSALSEMSAMPRPIAAVTAADVEKYLRTMGGSRPALGRFGALSRFLDWCHEEGRIPINPCQQIAKRRRPKPPSARAHYLKADQIARLWRAAEKLPYDVWRDLAQFLLAVPCRRGEAAQLDWAHLDLKAGDWGQPAHMTKNGEAHRLHLNVIAIQVIENRRQAFALAEANGDEAAAAKILQSGRKFKGLVFPSPAASGVIDTFSSIQAKLSAATEERHGADIVVPALTAWSWHDFRRSFATALGEARVPEVVADAILNHRQSATRGGVMGVYQRASRWEEQVEATKLWGALVTAALAARESDVDSGETGSSLLSDAA